MNKNTGGYFLQKNARRELTGVIRAFTIVRMEQEFICPSCGERTSLFFDLDDGEVQEIETDCIICGGRCQVLASFHYPTQSYDLEIVHDNAD